MSKNTAKTTDPIWDSRNSDEKVSDTPRTDQMVTVRKDEIGVGFETVPAHFARELERELFLAKPIGSMVPLPHHYAHSHETTPRKLWDEDDMRDHATAVVKDTLGRFEQELEKQRMHFFKLEDPRAEGIYNVLAVVHEALKAALNPQNASPCELSTQEHSRPRTPTKPPKGDSR